MITFNLDDPGMLPIQELCRAIYPTRLPINLYVFGANDNRPFSVYISSHLVNATNLATYIQQQGIIATVEDIGDPPQNNWIALRRGFRINSPRLAAKVCGLADYTLNNLITW